MTATGDTLTAEAEAIGRRAAADTRVEATTHNLAYAAGWAAGYTAGETDEARLWSETLGIVRQAAGRVTHEELARRRAEDPTDPCPTGCRKCSRCVRARAWWANGRRDYPGRGAA